MPAGQGTGSGSAEPGHPGDLMRDAGRAAQAAAVLTPPAAPLSPELLQALSPAAVSSAGLNPPPACTDWRHRGQVCGDIEDTCSACKGGTREGSMPAGGVCDRSTGGVCGPARSPGANSFHHRRWRIGKPFKGLPVTLRPTPNDGVLAVRFCAHPSERSNHTAIGSTACGIWGRGIRLAHNPTGPSTTERSNMQASQPGRLSPMSQHTCPRCLQYKHAGGGLRRLRPIRSSAENADAAAGRAMRQRRGRTARSVRRTCCQATGKTSGSRLRSRRMGKTILGRRLAAGR